MIDLFGEVKSFLKPVEVVVFYLGEGNKKAGSYWYVSPFRREKTASFCVSDSKGIHDFGDNQHYDIISFTQKLFNIKNTTAARKLIQDFHLPIDCTMDKPRIYYEKELAEYRNAIKRREKEKEIKIEYQKYLYNISCNLFKVYKDLIAYLQENRENLKETNLSRIYYKKDYYEWACDRLYEMSYEDVWQESEFWEDYLIWNLKK